MRRQQRLIAWTLAAVVGLIGCAGCMPNNTLWSWQYALGAAGGEINYLSAAVPIEQGLKDPELSDEQHQKLALVIDARNYARDVIGLNVGSSFRKFVNLHDKPLAWNLSASRMDAIHAYTWNIPVVGSITYLGFFNENELKTERNWLTSQGYDTFVYEIDAFSTLGYLPDPVASSILKRSVPNLADTVVHELLHNTVWSGGNDVFNESLATFVGRTGGVEFLTSKYGADSAEVQQAHDEYEDRERVQAFLVSVVDAANQLYAQDISSAEKIAQRESVFDAARQRFAAEVQPLLHDPTRYAGYATLKYNNAYLLVNGRYNSDLTVFSQTFELAGRDWATALGVFREAARMRDPVAYLQSRLNVNAKKS